MILDIDSFSNSSASVSPGGSWLNSKVEETLGGLEVSEIHPYNLKIYVKLLLQYWHCSRFKDVTASLSLCSF